MTNNPCNLESIFLNSNHNKRIIFLNTVEEFEDRSKSIIIYKVDKDDGLIEEFDSWDFSYLQDFSPINKNKVRKLVSKLSELKFKILHFIPQNKETKKILDSIGLSSKVDFDYDFDGNIVPIGYYLYRSITYQDSYLKDEFQRQNIRFEPIFK